MLTIMLTINNVERTLLHADTMDTAKTLALNYGAVNLEDNGDVTVRAVNRLLTIGSWRLSETKYPKNQWYLTWVGPDADQSTVLPTDQAHPWLIERIEHLIDTHPDTIVFTGALGAYITPQMNPTVRRVFSEWAVSRLAPLLLEGKQVAVAGNLLTATPT
jgi:hypothetical protein